MAFYGRADFLEFASEEISDRNAQRRLIGKGGLERDHSDAPLVAGDLGSALGAQEFRHDVLREAVASAIGAKIVVEFGSWHGCGLV
jgi:hypothetical protein